MISLTTALVAGSTLVSTPLGPPSTQSVSGVATKALAPALNFRVVTTCSAFAVDVVDAGAAVAVDLLGSADPAQSTRGNTSASAATPPRIQFGAVPKHRVGGFDADIFTAPCLTVHSHKDHAASDTDELLEIRLLVAPNTAR